MKIPCESCGGGPVYSTFSLKQCKPCQRRITNSACTRRVGAASLFNADGIRIRGWISGYRSNCLTNQTAEPNP